MKHPTFALVPRVGTVSPTAVDLNEQIQMSTVVDSSIATQVTDTHPCGLQGSQVRLSCIVWRGLLIVSYVRESCALALYFFEFFKFFLLVWSQWAHRALVMEFEVSLLTC